MQLHVLCYSSIFLCLFGCTLYQVFINNWSSSSAILWYIALSLLSPNTLAYFCHVSHHLKTAHTWKEQLCLWFEVLKVSETEWHDIQTTLDYIMFALRVKWRILASWNASKTTTKTRKYWFMLDRIQALWRVLMMHLHSLCSISQKHLATACHHPENHFCVTLRGYATAARNKGLKKKTAFLIF